MSILNSNPKSSDDVDVIVISIKALLKVNTSW